MANCRSCGAKIIWIRTSSGKSMPCNANPVVYWAAYGGRDRIVTPSGEVVACKLNGDQQTATGIGYIPHWSTCDHSERFRKPTKT